MKINIEAFAFKANSKQRVLNQVASNGSLNASDPPSDPPPMPPPPGSFKRPRTLNLIFQYFRKFRECLKSWANEVH